MAYTQRPDVRPPHGQLYYFQRAGTANSNYPAPVRGAGRCDWRLRPRLVRRPLGRARGLPHRVQRLSPRSTPPMCSTSRLTAERTSEVPPPATSAAPRQNRLARPRHRRPRGDGREAPFKRRAGRPACSVLHHAALWSRRGRPGGSLYGRFLAAGRCTGKRGLTTAQIAKCAPPQLGGPRAQLGLRPSRPRAVSARPSTSSRSSRGSTRK